MFQAKFEKKLRLLDEKRKLIEEDNLNKSEVNLAKERSNSQSPKPDAQLNTRQVFHLLKSEEKRQEVVRTSVGNCNIPTFNASSLAKGSDLIILHSNLSNFGLSGMQKCCHVPFNADTLDYSIQPATD